MKTNVICLSCHFSLQTHCNCLARCRYILFRAPTAFYFCHIQLWAGVFLFKKDVTIILQPIKFCNPFGVKSKIFSLLPHFFSMPKKSFGSSWLYDIFVTWACLFASHPLSFPHHFYFPYLRSSHRRCGYKFGKHSHSTNNGHPPPPRLLPPVVSLWVGLCSNYWAKPIENS
jgi:hypothetical protein